jgi:hypothetical protein
MAAQKAQKRRNIALIRFNGIVRETALVAQMRGPLREQGGGGRHARDAAPARVNISSTLRRRRESRANS